jgi:glutaredoxin
MKDDAVRLELIALFDRTGKAHHRAFAETDGEDPDWSIWYAESLQLQLGRLLDREFTRSRLVYCLMAAEFERATHAAESDWREYYADYFLERFAATATAADDRLALYHFDGCAFCSLVRSSIDRVGVPVELRNIRDDAGFRDELVAARGRATVPVLRITSPDGSERWMPESLDIATYLEKTYG